MRSDPERWPGQHMTQVACATCGRPVQIRRKDVEADRAYVDGVNANRAPAFREPYKAWFCTMECFSAASAD